ncbi:MAG: 2,3-bisphosphoglycerate-independent phosphoglycerate mutase [Pseudomonadota bacterium]
MAQKPVVLMILDGWGLTEPGPGNAPHLAQTPHFDRIWQTDPRTTLSASGQDVGLPPGQIGNSEVGHTNIGAGRVVWMDLPKINRAIADCSFAGNAALADFIAKLKDSGGEAHVMGLASPGGVHSHQDHMAAAARAISAAGVPVRLHLFTDGRDVGPKTARDQVAALLSQLADLPNTQVATVCGRYFAMDRDNRWDRVEQAYTLLTRAEGHADAETAPDALAAIDAAYRRGETDEFIKATKIGDYPGLAAGDGLFFINFRADRARQILAALLDPDFDGFSRGNRVPLAAALGMVEYSDRLNAFLSSMFPSEEIANTLGRWVSSQGKQQYRLAETEKYPHVTFFLNGGVEPPDPGEDRYVAPSPRVATYDLAPEMSAAEVTKKLEAAINGGYDLIVVNFANPDMVGHTGRVDAAVKACEATDRGLGTALSALQRADGAMLVTADHGNCEVMIDPETGGPHTAHTTNPVPLILVGASRYGLAGGGRLADLAPTVLALMGLPQPPEMTGRSLLIETP